jgi:hypothetical protein
MLKTIQEMKLFFWMAYGDSKDFVGSLMDVKTQGLCQGTGTAPAGCITEQKKGGIKLN